MSTFEDREVRCPHCGEREVRSVAVSLNAPRRRDLERAIVEGQFQLAACSHCGQFFGVDDPMILMDFDRGFWIGMFPARWESGWKRVEREPLDAWRRSMVENAPPVVRSWGKDFRVRSVFGLPALRDKLLCFLAGIDDRFLELLKLKLMRGPLTLHPAARPRLIDVDTRMLTFEIPRDDKQIVVDRQALEDIQLDPLGWAKALDEVSRGPYVDVGRILIGGDAQI